MPDGSARGGGGDPLHGIGLRVRPTNLEAEQALLGALMANNTLAYSRVKKFLLPEHFADRIHQEIYREIATGIEAGRLMDAVTLKSVFENRGVLEEVGGTKYLVQLLSAMVGVINAGEYGRAIHDCYLRRELIEAAAEIANAAFAGSSAMDVRQLAALARERVDHAAGSLDLEDDTTAVGRSQAVCCDNERDYEVLTTAGLGRVFHLKELMHISDARAKQLGKIEKFVLAAKATQASKQAMEELARRLGRHRCWLVTWPEGCTCAHDVVDFVGPDTLQNCIEEAAPYPIEGAQKVRHGTLRELRDAPAPPVLTTGTWVVDDILKIPGEGRLIIVTGLPNHGKTAWVSNVMVHQMENCGRKFVVFSPEMQPWQHYVAQLAQIFTLKPFRGSQYKPGMDNAEITTAEAFFASRLVMLVADTEEHPPTLDWVIDRARVAILRDSMTDLVIDPWNALEHSRGNLTQTEYVSVSLQRLLGFAHRHGVNVWILAHPSKLKPAKPGGEVPHPTLNDIEWSAAWGTRADVGICVHTPENLTQVHILKTKQYRWGRRGSMAEISMVPDTGKYQSPT